MISILEYKEMVAYYCPPGKHDFLVVCENADFMTADLEANRVYYVLVSPHMGLWKTRFSLKPLKKQSDVADPSLDSGNLEKWYKTCSYVQKTEESGKWLTSHGASIESTMAEYLHKWSEKTLKDKRMRTID
ncbi:MAG: hypothetical protein EOL87_15745 [Spartobacteria bacterium]|nr:hypothetical protein [Spartobacteria bacterium]